VSALLDGRALSRARNKALKARVPSLARPPGLAVVLVGEDPASEVYVRRKGVVADRLGFVHRQINLPADVAPAVLDATIDTLNADPDIDGILVQLPLPAGLDGKGVVERIDPDKDADGLTTASMGRLLQGRPVMVPCTPLGVMRLIASAGISLEGASACVIGRSVLVGRPMAVLLEQANATVTLCHSRTRDLEAIVGRSDVVVAAIGRPEAIPGAWIREGATVIDVGINRLDDGRLVGDVAFESAAARAGAITPVPGGVGPMTIAMLMENTFRAAVHRQGADPALLEGLLPTR
jgi:methylenetetrahydrofolate dehydrogenase (NADP+)/methenyltetrahydrofolate cyclohydrolase